MFEPVLYESHLHTPLCNHATGQPEEYAAVAQKRGLKGIIVTCHNPMADGYSSNVRMSLDQFDDYVAMTERARDAWAGRVDVRLGLECDYAPGMEPWLEQLLARAEFHHVLGSIHPQVPEYKAQYFDGDYQSYCATYFDHLAMAAESGLFDTLSHPDLIKNEDPQNWNLEKTLDVIRAALDRISVTGVAMELNTSGLNKRVREMNPNLTMLREMRVRHIPVVLGADAHTPQRVAADYDRALDMLAETGYTSVSLFLERSRREVDITLARASLEHAGKVVAV